jgi:broad specificity phosphatase PhoE
MKIYLVRHGQTDWNYQKKIQGQQDVDINEQGIRQAEKLAEILKNVPVFSSDNSSPSAHVLPDKFS